ncbi:GPR158 [Mytilus edulis]|uniref:GPR158 n=1 Tax=Mytilus edulis TaxID=6550 RepID=A0A8S3TBV1_MYTED|nr:GPR158 [Mytilus edulis]
MTSSMKIWHDYITKRYILCYYINSKHSDEDCHYIQQNIVSNLRNKKMKLVIVVTTLLLIMAFGIQISSQASCTAMCTKLNHDRCYGCCHAKDCFNGGNCDSLTKRCVCNGCMGMKAGAAGKPIKLSLKEAFTFTTQSLLIIAVIYEQSNFKIMRFERRQSTVPFINRQTRKTEVMIELYDLSNLENIDLSYNKISKDSIKDEDLDSEIGRAKRLTVQGNDLGSLEDLTFVPFYFLKLEYLDLSYCSLKSLQDMSIINLGNLKFLNLSYNFLSDFDEDFLPGEMGLEQLDISYNKITTVKKVPVLIELKVLHMDYNGIDFIKDGAFSTLLGLEVLSLVENNMKTLRPNMLPLKSIFSLKEIRLDKNPWRCDCNMKWLLNDMDDDFNFKNFTLMNGSTDIQDENIVMYFAKQEDGYWSQPYFDCGFSDIWLVTFSVPIFGQDATGKPAFKGVAFIDMNLNDTDINQCDLDDDDESIDIFLNVFRSTHECLPDTKCQFLPGLGFKKGGYSCLQVNGSFSNSEGTYSLTESHELFYK